MSDVNVQHIRDTRALSALTHPLRRQLMDVMKLNGPATASALSQATGQAVGNVSHHLRVLADAALIEEVPELARDRRERWWRLVSGGVRWTHTDFEHDPAEAAVADAAARLLIDRHMDFVRGWLTDRKSEEPDWRDGCAVSTETWLHLTPDEARQLAKELTALLDRWASRPIPDDGQQRRPVFAFAHAVPATP
ncbi:helix-turn-helix domain-containing protein (plasmid) [Streptomyces sp. NBC_01724]|uniref:helix-turn-helix domain-containing protein n=1 Tax=Streptomyces sp. NBC_01724 TaxID=2975922 RepID=UPI002E3750CD|nr:helix-turn-helix domain-containing protein [Streptomyces sp. NBC_01724]